MTNAAERRRRIGTMCGAILVAVAVNVFIFLALAGLNFGGALDGRRAADAASVLTVAMEPEPHEPASPTPERSPPEPEPVLIDLDRPALPSINLDAIRLEVIVPVAPIMSEPSTVASSLAAADSVDEPPRERYVPPPRYPHEALTRGIEGEVVVKLLINERGVVKDVQVVQVTGDESFRDAVLDVARTWQFRPARDDGHPVAVWGIKRIRFVLEE